MKYQANKSQHASQLVLAFDEDARDEDQGASTLVAPSNVVDFASMIASRIAIRKRQQSDSQDSILDEILSDARKISW